MPGTETKPGALQMQNSRHATPVRDSAGPRSSHFVGEGARLAEAFPLGSAGSRSRMEKRERVRRGVPMLLLSLSCLLASLGECAGEPGLRAMLTMVSDSRTSTVTVSMGGLPFSYCNSTLLDMVFLVNTSAVTPKAMQGLSLFFTEDIVTLNSLILDGMAVRLPGQRIDIPTVTVYPSDPGVSEGTVMLNCLVSELFPPRARISFWKNGRQLDSGENAVLSTFSDTWGYSILKHIEIEPAVGEKYSCVVELINTEQIQEHWELEDSDRFAWVQVAICAVGFTVGALGIIAGLLLIFYRRESQVLSVGAGSGRSSLGVRPTPPTGNGAGHGPGEDGD